MEFGGVLKAMRKKAGYSQEELAYELNTTQSTVSKLERNQKIPDIYTVKQWAETTCAKDMIIAFFCNVDVATVAQGLMHILGGFVVWQMVMSFTF
ncbi:helix-turn-helix domain-containing protein [Bacillus sp. FJAT-45350]|uniref:helix-turn-helix domain-containing protein n=1 Tax=Bacillus sp. FJAT-45350 TaxID=2011014 RepID=UPI00211CF1AA|nr:helix-turn-helix transcriptional regulator [Bacillus sp. FJAT-45350]